MIKIGLLGSGFVATFYMNGLRDVPDQKVVISYSQTEKRAKTFAKEWKIHKYTTDMIKVTENPEVDLVIIALPNFVHKEAALLACKAKKNLVCTKPLARNAEEAKIMLDAVEKAGVLHGYAETEVFSPAVMKARDVIERGGIGKVFWVRSREAHYGPHADWFWDPKLSGGGALMDMGCHCVAASRYFVGKEAKAVEAMAWGDTLVHPVKCEDNALLMVKFEGNQLGQAEVSWSSRGGLDLRNEVYGDKGVIFTDVTRGTPISVFTLESTGYVVEKSEMDKGWVIPCVDEARTYGYHEEMRYFVECVKKGVMPRENFEDGYICNAILDAGYKSMKTKRWEKIAY
jgi:predicted dehydrogenase